MRIPLSEFFSRYTLASLLEKEISFFTKDTPRFFATDSREVLPGDLFFSLAKEESSRLRHLQEAKENGASAAVGANAVPALGKMAKAYRNHVSPKSVAITGSYGKTTVKELLFSILSPVFPTHATHGNENNELGLPLTVLSMNESTHVLVVELGMRLPGEISYLSKIARPDIALITAVGRAHIGRLGSVEAIRKAKLEICDGMEEGGVLITTEKAVGSIRPIGTKALVLSDSPYAPPALLTVRTLYPYTVFSLKTSTAYYQDLALPALGAHMAENAALAVLTAASLGVSENDIRRGLFSYRPPVMRSESAEIHGIHVISDCYNACPETMESAKDTLVLTKRHFPDARAYALLGDMLELGEDSPRLHTAVGRLFGETRIDGIFTFGEYRHHYLDGARAAGFRGILSSSPKELPPILRRGDILLCKASRALKGEALLDEILTTVKERMTYHE